MSMANSAAFGTSFAASISSNSCSQQAKHTPLPVQEPSCYGWTDSSVMLCCNDWITSMTPGGGTPCLECDCRRPSAMAGAYHSVIRDGVWLQLRVVAHRLQLPDCLSFAASQARHASAQAVTLNSLRSRQAGSKPCSSVAGGPACCLAGSIGSRHHQSRDRSTCSQRPARP
jgi:hypothetical protein